MSDFDSSADLKLLALTIKALIDTHPNKAAFKKQYLAYLDKPETAGEHFEGLGKTNFDRSPMASFIKSASTEA
ncbi:hypothetical protein V0R37_18610 [Pollutimonas sp. H1-120]|uniref:hypothetical protein n=1 Tax=Pollutimonas sp. H1-120 TaxID=3148824 RepID=UPI003B52B366